MLRKKISRLIANIRAIFAAVENLSARDPEKIAVHAPSDEKARERDRGLGRKRARRRAAHAQRQAVDKAILKPILPIWIKT